MPFYNDFSSNKDMDIKTKIRRSHLGIRYDIYADGAYRATAYTAAEIEPLIARIEDTAPMQAV